MDLRELPGASFRRHPWETARAHFFVELVRRNWLLLLDVIEHIPDDVAFLGQLVSTKLEPGGAALLSVPAWPVL